MMEAKSDKRKKKKEEKIEGMIRKHSFTPADYESGN